MSEVFSALVTQRSRKNTANIVLYILSGTHAGKKAALEYAGELPPYIQRNSIVRVNGCLEKRRQKTIVKIQSADDITLDASVESQEAFRKQFKKVPFQKVLELVPVANTARVTSVVAKQEELELTEEQEKYLKAIKKAIERTTIGLIQKITDEAGLGLDIDRAAQIHETLKYRAGRQGIGIYELITSHPWILCQVEGITRATADKLAQHLGKAKTNPEMQLYNYVMSIAWNAARSGHSYIPLMEAYRKTLGYQRELYHTALKVSTFEEIMRGEKLYNAVYGRCIVCRQFGQETAKYREECGEPENKAREASSALYPSRVYYAERAAAELLAERLLKPAEPISLAPIKGLDAHQQKAVETALSHQVTVWTGQAGSGKTHTIQKMVEALKEAGIPSIILAPTAIAADRLSQKLPDVPAYTIHRFAGIAAESKDLLINAPAISQETALEQETYIFVDEISMCDTIAMWALLNSIKGQKARLVLVGDPGQLPSVGPGGVFDQLITVLKEQIPVCELGTSYRSSDRILRLAHMVRNEGRFELEDNEAITLLEQTEIEKVAEQLKQAGYNIEDVLFISPTRYTEKLSAERVVPALRRIWNPDGRPIPGTTLYTGDPVICIENDYAELQERQSIRHIGRNIDIYNGYRGVITCCEGETVWVRYWIKGEEKEVPYTLYELPYWLEQAYCITVHKSQGGGWPVVVFIGQEGMDRQLIYTGITRAKDRLILIGRKEVWEEGAITKTPPPFSKFGYRVLKEMEKAAERENERKNKNGSRNLQWE